MKRSILKQAYFSLGMIILTLGLAIPLGSAGAISGASFTVNSNSDADNGTDGICTLREAIWAAASDIDYHECIHSGSSFGDDGIFFSISGDTTITLTTTLPNINGAITIDGYNAGLPVAIDGANTYAVLYSPGGSTLTLRNITIQHGASTGGGGLTNNGTLYVFNSAFLNNTVSGDGGGIANVTGTATIVNTTFTGNSAGYGGGATNNSGTITILNSTFSGNTATSQGAAFSTWQGGVPAPVTSISNTIMANSSVAEDCWNGSGATLTGTNNIIETTTIDGSSCSSIATTTSDPQLGSLTGTPSYYPILPASPAFDTGDDTTCVTSPVSNASQNGITRPQGIHCDIGSYEYPMSVMTFTSIGAQDGWVLESAETSNRGGLTDSSATTFSLGDDADDRQYRSILHFNTANLPDTAVVTSATIKIKKQGLVGTSPLTTHGQLRVDIRKPYFGTSALTIGDFQATASKTAAAFFGTTPLSNWYSAVISASSSIYLNNTGTTQFRLRFSKDDNDDHGADYLKFYSGDAGASVKPKLIVQYYVP